jgi:hypothetical protein
LKFQPGTVVICDNLASDYTRAAGTALRDIGYWLLYRPSYSPALNPVEMACSNPKARLRRIEPRPFDQGFDAFTEICNRRSPDDCWNVFCEAGYGLNEKRGALGDIPQIIVSSPRCTPLSKSYGKRLCCINPTGDSLFESSMIAGGYEPMGPYKVQDHELVCLQ